MLIASEKHTRRWQERGLPSCNPGAPHRYLTSDPTSSATSEPPRPSLSPSPPSTCTAEAAPPAPRRWPERHISAAAGTRAPGQLALTPTGLPPARLTVANPPHSRRGAAWLRAHIAGGPLPNFPLVSEGRRRDGRAPEAGIPHSAPRQSPRKTGAEFCLSPCTHTLPRVLPQLCPGAGSPAGGLRRALQARAGEAQPPLLPEAAPRRPPLTPT